MRTTSPSLSTKTALVPNNLAGTAAISPGAAPADTTTLGRTAATGRVVGSSLVGAEELDFQTVECLK